MRNMRHNTQKKHNIAALCLVLAALSLSVTAFVAAKYSSKIQSDIHGVIPESFQLECTPYEDGHEYFVMEGTELVTFSVTSTDAVTVKITHPSGESTPLSPTDGTYKIITESWQVDETHTVTVETTTPYAKKITFKLRVVAKTAESSYSIKTYASRVELTLNIGSTVPTNVSINYGTLAPDNLNELMKDWKTANTQGTLSKLQPYSKYTLIFFGTPNISEVVDKQLTSGMTIDLTASASQQGQNNGNP